MKYLQLDPQKGKPEHAFRHLNPLHPDRLSSDPGIQILFFFTLGHSVSLLLYVGLHTTCCWF